MREACVARPAAQHAYRVGVDRSPLHDPLLGGIELLLDEASGPRLPLRGLGVEVGDNGHGRQLVLISTAAASSSGAASGASATAVSAALLGGSTRSASAGR